MANKIASEQDSSLRSEATKISATVHDDHISSINGMLGEHLRKSKCDVKSSHAFHTNFEIDFPSPQGAHQAQARLILQGIGMLAALKLQMLTNLLMLTFHPGLLDIDKCIESRPPLTDLQLWVKPRVSQRLFALLICFVNSFD